MNKTPRILCLTTMALMLIVAVQGLWHIIPLRELKGVYVMDKCPRPTMSTVFDGNWQAQADKYLKGNFGFREPAIRMYNQYVYSCYGKSTNKGVMVGRDGYLYERYFVEDYYESRMYKYTDDPQQLADMFDLEARRLAKLQGILQEYGTNLFVVIPPGKDILYPEHLPPQDTMTRTPGPRAYPEYPRLFDRYGVHYVDVLGWFLAMRDKVPYALMTQNGTHWSNIAATYAFDSIMRYMQGLGGPTIRPVAVGEPYYGKTREPDNDLGQLLNLVVAPGQPRNMYADVTLLPDTAAAKPGLVVIGDSFFWTVTYNYPVDSLFRYTHYWFYNNTVYFDPEHDNVSQYDLAEALTDADYVMLLYCSGQLYDLGNGVLTKALVACCYDDEEVDSVRDDICRRIRSDEHWLKVLERKSSNEGISLDEAILNDANYLINTRPEEYFPALTVSGIPTKRCRRLMR